MSRYIDADKLYEDMQWSIQHDMYDKPFDYLEEIDCQPTADVRENVRGHWELKTCDLYGLADKVTAWANYCSVCGYHYGTPYNFCPHCGADMRGDNHD